ncbi:MAG: phosphodiester glycosidase family protein [Deltaproteobacteria bacterium]|nr:phosphodiester glycosidase family protein [Deltaproteobacteria bacterium]
MILGAFFGASLNGFISFGSSIHLLSSQFSGKSVTVFRSPLTYNSIAQLTANFGNNDFRVIDARRLKKETINVKSFVKLFEVVGCVNASFFSNKNDPIGLILSRGKILNPLHESKGSIKNIFAVTMRGFYAGTANVNFPTDSIEAIQTGHTFSSTNEFAEKFRKFYHAISILCISKSGKQLTALSSLGLIANKNVVKIIKAMDCNTIITMDGGRSSSLWFKFGDSAVGVNELAYVPVIFCVLPKQNLLVRLNK